MSNVSIMGDAVSPLILAGGLLGTLIILAFTAFALFWLIAYIRKKNKEK